MDNKKRNIDVTLIDLNPDNEWIFGYEDIDFLATTIEEDGFSGVIEVYAKKDGRYEISSGHRRYLAAVKDGMKEIPCIVSEEVDDVTKAKKLIKSNLMNRQMTALKMGRALQYYEQNVLIPEKKAKRLQGRVRDELARVFNLSAASVQRYMALLKLIPEFQTLTDRKDYPYSNLLCVAGLEESMQKEVYDTLCGMVGNDEIEGVSKILIEQVVAKLTAKEEKKKNELNKEIVPELIPSEGPMISEPEESFEIYKPRIISDGNNENAGLDEPVNEFSDNMFMPDIDKEDSNFYDGSMTLNEQLTEEQIASMTVKEEDSIDNEVIYLCNRINALFLNNGKVKNKDTLIKYLEEILTKIK